MEGKHTRKTVTKEDKPIDGNVVDIGEKTIEEIVKTENGGLFILGNPSPQADSESLGRVLRGLFKRQ